MIEEKSRVPNRPARYRLISPDGAPMGTFDSALEAASAAGGFWPGVGQRDHDNGGAGWDIEVVGADQR